MEQITFFDPPYKYIIDSSSILAQKPNDTMPRKVHKSMWRKIEQYIEEKLIVTCSEIEEEVQKDDVVGNWLGTTQCDIIPIDDSVQCNVRQIVTEHPKMISFSGGKGSSSGDAFLIATAMKYRLIIITEEKKGKQNKIPQICSDYGIQSVNLTELCILEGWEF